MISATVPFASASSSRLGSFRSAPFSSILAWPVRPAMPISAWVDLVIGVSRSISVSAMATVGLSRRCRRGARRRP